jgi:hypothetical protein
MNRMRDSGVDTTFESSRFGELKGVTERNRFIIESAQLNTYSLKGLNATQYLSAVESNISTDLISAQNYREMKELASCFQGSITSFFGFETRMNNRTANSDFLFAVSSKKGERELLNNLFTSGKLPQSFLSEKEWKNIEKFVTTWVDPDSTLYDNVLGVWFEFDLINDSTQVPVPCIFLHTIPLQVDNTKEMQCCTWLTQSALPLLIGRSLSPTIESQVLKAIRQLPKGASVFQVGVMLSRSITGVRLVFNKIEEKDILPYLKKLGWSDTKEGLSSLIEELQNQGMHIVLHVTIGENGIEPKIGLECSFYPFRYHNETKWPEFFEYLIQKGWCLPEKKNALLGFSGIKQEDPQEKLLPISSMRLSNTPALVRYISHVKLVITPDHPIEAKVYSGVRLFNSS